jgi:hypothetical protein
LAVPLNQPPLPADTPLVEPNRKMNWFWVQYFTTRDQTIQAASSVVVDTGMLSAQGASIAATPINVGNSAAFYRVSTYGRVTRPATTSSSFQVVVQWTEGGQAMTKTYTAVTGNTVTSFHAEQLPIPIDANTSLTYAVTYASVGATTMQYELRVIAERLA